MRVTDSSLPLFDSEPEADEGEAIADPEDLSFEEAFAALEETVSQLERGDSTIDELVALYERGTALAKLCNARLDAAELRISKLAPTEGGGYEEEPFGG